MKINVLIVEDEEFDVRRIKNTLRLYNNIIKIYDIVSTGNDALDCLKNSKSLIDVVVLDYQISGGLYGKELIKEIKLIDSTIQVIIITKMTINQTDPEFASQLIKNGAYWFGTKNPTDIEDYIYQPTDFILAILNAYEKRNLQLEKQKLQFEHKKSQEILENNNLENLIKWKIIGNSNAVENVKVLVEKYAPVNASVLITGESGTGKELVARNIHFKSPRKFEKFVVINCSAIPFNLFESELFGYEKGAFTDAKSGKIGLFEKANHGTLFLDEVSELPLKEQSKLLRVLETGEIEKIGRKHEIIVDVRVIAATNKDLNKEISKNKFREDLYYRLNILNISIPPLRERRSDIEVLSDYFLKKYINKFQLGDISITPEAQKLLVNYDWPGNVRQLKNVLQRSVLLADKSIDTETINIGLRGNPGDNDFRLKFINPNKMLTLKEAEFNFRKEYTKFIRSKTKTDAEASKLLGIAPSNFHRLCKELGLK